MLYTIMIHRKDQKIPSKMDIPKYPSGVMEYLEGIFAAILIFIYTKLLKVVSSRIKGISRFTR